MGGESFARGEVDHVVGIGVDAFGIVPDDARSLQEIVDAERPEEFRRLACG